MEESPALTLTRIGHRTGAHGLLPYPNCPPPSPTPGCWGLRLGHSIRTPAQGRSGFAARCPAEARRHARSKTQARSFEWIHSIFISLLAAAAWRRTAVWCSRQAPSSSVVSLQGLLDPSVCSLVVRPHPDLPCCSAQCCLPARYASAYFSLTVSLSICSD